MTLQVEITPSNSSDNVPDSDPLIPPLAVTDPLMITVPPSAPAVPESGPPVGVSVSLRAAKDPPVKEPIPVTETGAGGGGGGSTCAGAGGRASVGIGIG